MITLPMGRNGKDSGVPFGSAQGTAHDCARFLSQRMWGRNETDLFPWKGMPNMGCRNLGIGGNWEWCWRNLEKRWQNGETESQKNGGVRQAHPPKIFIWITAWKSGGKDSGILAEKNCFLLALSDGAEHRPYKRLWLLLCFVPSDNIAEGKSDFFQL